MQGFDASLVREKIVFHSDGPAADSAGKVVRSNRMAFTLGTGAVSEYIVIRARNMHTTMRLAGRVVHAQQTGGRLAGRTPGLDWKAVWKSVISAYEREFSPDNWCVIYVNGRPAFRTMEECSFADVIETCALVHKEDYEETMRFAEKALKQVGHAQQIFHDSNLASVMTDDGGALRCSFMHRDGGRETKYSFIAEGGVADNRITYALSVASAYMEGLGLRLVTRGLDALPRKKAFERGSREEKQMRMATTRLMALDRAIVSFDDVYRVHYRPERPLFFLK